MLAALARIADEQGFTPSASPDSIVEWFLLVLRRADAKTVSLVWYRDELEYAVNALIGNPLPPAAADS